MKALVIVLCIFTLSCSSSEKIGWDKEMETVFLTPLTYPHSEWKADDFGTAISSEELELLEKFRPQIYVAPKGLYPIDFYKDYLPRTNLMNAEKEVVLQSPTREDLKKHERKEGHYLDYVGEHKYCSQEDCGPNPVPIYGRVYTGKISSPYKEPVNRDYIILKYTAVFSASGLPAKMAWFNRFGAWLAGDLDVWHELDIHGAIHIFVEKQTLKPQILLLAQHNHFRTYLIGKDVQLKDGQLHICYAERSNEPYPCDFHREKPHHYRSVGNPKNMRFVINGQSDYIDGGFDRVYGTKAGAIPLSYNIQSLPSKDPLYVSWIPLGDRMKLFGMISSFFRDGPPGIDLNTFPQKPKYTDIAQIWYFREDDRQVADLYERAFSDFFKPLLADVYTYNGRRLWRSIIEVEKDENRKSLTY